MLPIVNTLSAMMDVGTAQRARHCHQFTAHNVESEEQVEAQAVTSHSCMFAGANMASIPCVVVTLMNIAAWKLEKGCECWKRDCCYQRFDPGGR